jgi:hypothetical protein
MAAAFLMRRFATLARDLPLLRRVQRDKAAALWLLRHHAPPFIVFASANRESRTRDQLSARAGHRPHRRSKILDGQPSERFSEVRSPSFAERYSAAISVSFTLNRNALQSRPIPHSF